MSKECTLTVRIGKTLRNGIEKCAKENDGSISEVVGLALTEFCERRRRERLRRRNRPRALRAFRAICGAVSHGSLAQNIDEKVYGRMR